MPLVTRVIIFYKDGVLCCSSQKYDKMGLYSKREGEKRCFYLFFRKGNRDVNVFRRAWLPEQGKIEREKNFDEGRGVGQGMPGSALG